MEYVQETKQRTIREDIRDIQESLRELEGSKNGKRNNKAKRKKEWKMPGSWKRTIKHAKKGDPYKVLVFYLNMKGQMEKPRMVPVLPGDVVMIRHKAYDANPMAMWTLGKKGPKALLIREIDRRPVSNLDYNKVKGTGYGTDSDEILIKATMKAIQGGAGKPMNKAALVVIGIILMVVVAYMMTASGA